MEIAEDYVKKFLNPISKKKPSGDYLRYEEIYDQLSVFEENANAFFTETSTDGDIWAPAEGTKIDWHHIIQIAEKSLEEKSKDLQIVIWLVFAKSKHQGIIGLYESVSLFYSLIKEFWDSCHPQPDENQDYSVRIGVINRLRNQLGFYFSIVNLVDLKKGSVFNYLDYQAANSDISSQFDGSDIQKSIQSTPFEFFEKFSLLAQQIGNIIDEIDIFLEKNLPGDDSSFLQSKNKIDEILSILPTETPVALSKVKDDATEDHESNSPAFSMNLIDSAINSRRDAFLTLQKISNVLKEIEPHSVATSIIDQAIEWQHCTPHKISEQLQERGFSLLDLIKMFPERK